MIRGEKRIQVLAMSQEVSAHPNPERPRLQHSDYRIRFLDRRWLIYRFDQIIADFPGDNAVIALAFLRQKEEEQLAPHA